MAPESCIPSQQQSLHTRLIYVNVACPARSEAVSVTGRGSPQGCEIFRIAHCPNNRLTVGGEVISRALSPQTVLLLTKHFVITYPLQWDLKVSNSLEG
jgi:hypothetical protein